MVKLCPPLQSCHTFLKLQGYNFLRQNLIFNYNNSSNTISNTSTTSSNSSISASKDVAVFNPYDHSDTAHLFWYEYISVCIVTNLIVLVGITGNILNVLILSRTGIGKDTTSTLLLALSVVDFLVLFTYGFQYVSCTSCYLGEIKSAIIETYIAMYMPAHGLIFTFLSTDITAVIAFERAVSVFFPFKVSSIFTKKSVRIILLCLSVNLFLFLTPVYIGLSPAWTFDTRFNQRVTRFYIFNLDPATFLPYSKWIENINLIAAMVTVVVCGTATAIKLNVQSKSRTTMTSQKAPSLSGQEQRAVKMLLVICFLSFLGNVPNITTNYLFDYLHDDFVKHPMYCLIAKLMFTISTLNSSVNFFVYFLMSTKFRRAYNELFCRRPSEKQT